MEALPSLSTQPARSPRIGAISCASVTCTSDERKKSSIATAAGHARIEAIRPVTFKWKDARDPHVHAGVIAQELEEVMPEAVKTDADGFKSVEYHHVWTLLLASHQALLKSHRTLEAKVEALESRLARAGSLRPRSPQ